jgi:hypothetical protein
VSDGYTGEPAKKGFALQGCLLSFLVWLCAGFLLLGTQAGDCFEHCAAQTERRFTGLAIIVGAIAFNLLGLFLVARARVRSEDN